jgi:hypothetical protein
MTYQKYLRARPFSVLKAQFPTMNMPLRLVEVGVRIGVFSNGIILEFPKKSSNNHVRVEYSFTKMIKSSVVISLIDLGQTMSR